MKLRNNNILILGAGPAGIPSAYELHRNGYNVTIVEKNEEVGGLARTLDFGEFRTDIGPHRFFSKNRHLYDLIDSLIGERWIKVNRLTRFYINGKFFLYPLELKNALLNIGIYRGFRIVFDYTQEKIKNIFVRRNFSSFEDYTIANFGRTLAELNMLNYTEKIWGLPCSQLSADWAKQRIKGLSLGSAIKKAIFKGENGPKTLVDQFYYPDTGTGLIYKRMKEEIISDNENKIYLKSIPTKIVHENGMINEIIINNKGNEINFKPNYVISSIPITEFITLLYPMATEDIRGASKKFRYRSHVSVFITLNKQSIFPDQWIYLPDKEIPFGRIMSPKNFSKKMSPEDKTSLFVEYFCWENDEIWNMDDNELFELTVKWLEKLNFLNKMDVINYFTHKEKYAYPVYDLIYKEYLEEIKKYLDQFKNLQYIGRSGRFKYNNQDHALEMGILAARSLIDKKQYNIDEVGAEQEYFEKYYVQ